LLALQEVLRVLLVSLLVLQVLLMILLVLNDRLAVRRRWVDLLAQVLSVGRALPEQEGHGERGCDRFCV
jgi:hypothetical protein